MATKHRLKEIDIVRGITIFLVVLGHSGMSDGILSEMLRNFRMPLFFIVSGYLFSNSKFVSNMRILINDKFRTLIIPYISFCIISSVIWTSLQLFNGQGLLLIKPIIGMLYGNGNWIVGNDPIWFLVCLFSAFVIFNFVLHKLKKQTSIIKAITFLSIGFIGYIISKFIWLPMSLDIALTAVFFMFIGNLLKKKMVLLNHKLMLSLTIISLILFIMTLFFNIPLDMNNRVYGNFFWFYIGGISGSILIIFISKHILAKSNFICSVFSYLGKESIVILGFHYSIGLYIIIFIEKLTGVGISTFLTAIIATSFSLFLGLFIKGIPILSFLFKGEVTQLRYSRLKETV